jgi:putative restriction endonuclease
LVFFLGSELSYEKVGNIMPDRRNWTREELIVTFNFYCKTPFGKLHSRNPDIIELADLIGRTPDAVAMKLSNFAALDPSLTQKGLPNASRLDKEIWDEFNSNWEEKAIESEIMIKSLKEKKKSKKAKTKEPGDDSHIEYLLQTKVDSPTEYEAITKQRLGQSFFRKTVLASYNYQCAITGCTFPEMLIASHILPWSKYPDQRLNPHNGICLVAHFDRAFDAGLIGFDKDYRLVLGKRIKESENEFVKSEFVGREGKILHLPKKFTPQVELLKTHLGKVV